MTQFLLIAGAVAGYALFVLVFPVRPCRSCRGWGSRGGRGRVACPRCQGTGRTFRLGARAVHRLAAEAWRSARGRRGGR